MQSDGIKWLATTVHSKGTALQAHRWRSYLEFVNHLLKRYANAEVIAETDAAILRFTLPVGITMLQYVKALFASTICVGDIYDKKNSKWNVHWKSGRAHPLQPLPQLVKTSPYWHERFNLSGTVLLGHTEFSSNKNQSQTNLGTRKQK